MKCDYCGGQMKLEDNIKIYIHKSYGNSLICENYPECDTYVGVHKNTNNPLGHPANKALRNLRIACHDEFDPLWRGKKSKHSRKEAYEMLRKPMGKPKSEMHIAKFDEEDCNKFLRILKYIRR